MRPSSVVALARDVSAVARERQLGVQSAGLAYHAFNTLVPLAILLLVGVSLADGFEVALDVLESATGLDATTIREALEEATVDGGGQRVRAGVIAGLIFIWSAVRLFRAVNAAFTDVYGSRKSQSVASAAVDVALIVVTMAVGVALVGGVGVALALVADGLWWRVSSPLVLAVLLTVVLFPMYYQFPQTAVTVREVLPGTLFAALSWTALAIGFRLYVSTSESVALFGVAGAVLIVLTWVYLGGLCVLLGAVLNAVLADHVEAEDAWVPMREVWSRYA